MPSNSAKLRNCSAASKPIVSLSFSEQPLVILLDQGIRCLPLPPHTPIIYTNSSPAATIANIEDIAQLAAWILAADIALGLGEELEVGELV